MVLGHKMAPWEKPETADTYLRPLGNARSIILGLLEREPEKRMTMSQCVLACKRIVAGGTTDAIGSELTTLSIPSTGGQLEDRSRNLYFAQCASSLAPSAVTANSATPSASESMYQPPY
jgi:hypothetical protein